MHFFRRQSTGFNRRFRSALLISTLAFSLSTLTPAAQAYEWQNDGIFDASDSAFISASSWFNAGPAWLMNSMPGAHYRPRIIYRPLETQDSTSNAPYVGTLYSPFNVSLFNNVAVF